ncbi:CPBP family intramembrane glutamic endopeptidase [Mycolicibacter nonchromogenicus]|uniref:CPBP family intramembrane glutamic endopeptidase n=1 Tax=Mycolicibacter nonchromogenicus TaxID=1782 RepID=UPI003B3B9995
MISAFRSGPSEPVEPPAVQRRRRRIVVVVLVLGAALLGVSLTRVPGDPSFYWLTTAMAVVWGGGALVSGPLRLGWVSAPGRRRRPILMGVGIGGALGAVFIAGSLGAREIEVIAEPIGRVLSYAHDGHLGMLVVVTVLNGVAEELFFRGALYSALGHTRPLLYSTVLYTVATSVSGNAALGIAAVVLGTVCALERRATGGVLAPVLTHLVWGLVMMLVLPPLFAA